MKQAGAPEKRKAQSSFTAVISTVALVGILSFSILRIADISGTVADEGRMAGRIASAIAASNDLISNPGYNETSLGWRGRPEHLGLAEYDQDRRMVLDHVLEREKIGFLQKEGIGFLEQQYGVANASLRIESLSGEKMLDIGFSAKSRVQVARLALVRKGDGFEPVRLVLALEA